MAFDGDTTPQGLCPCCQSENTRRDCTASEIIWSAASPLPLSCILTNQTSATCNLRYMRQAIDSLVRPDCLGLDKQHPRNVPSMQHDNYSETLSFFKRVQLLTFADALSEVRIPLAKAAPDTCLQLIERYACCGCVYYKHPVDPCAQHQHQHAEGGRKKGWGDVQTREVKVGFACRFHSKDYFVP